MNCPHSPIAIYLLSLGLLSCRAAPTPERAVYAPPPIIQPEGAIAPHTLSTVLTEPLEFQVATRPDALVIQPQTTGARVVTSQGIQLAQLTIAGDKLKLTNAIGQHVANVVIYHHAWRLEDPTHTEIITLRRHQVEDRYAFETPMFQPLYRLQADEHGWNLVTPDHQVLYQVQQVEQQLVLRNAGGQTVLTSSGQVSAIALVCFGLDWLTREQQAALAYAVQLVGE